MFAMEHVKILYYLGSSARICTLLLSFALVLCMPMPICAFYVPGVAPVEFRMNDNVEVKAVKMTSTKTQLPYEYYSLPFCQPKTGLVYKNMNLGEILRGDRIVNTPYDISMMKKDTCHLLCQTKSLSKKERLLIAQRIKEDYSVHLLIDNLPAAMKFQLSGSTKDQYENGFPLGHMHNEKAILNNHLVFVIKYHTEDEKLFRIVGFEVRPMSVHHSQFNKDCVNGLTRSTLSQEVNLNENEDQQILFSYDVFWEKSNVHWSNRWDVYLAMSDAQIHWFSIINSVVIIFFLSAILTLIMIRTLRKDIAKYNRDDDVEETLEETGWKLVHGDVFRPPRRTALLSALVGSGLQLLCMLFITITMAMLGMLSPASRGSLMSASVFIYVFMGIIAGYISARLYKTVRGQLWKRTALLTALLFPTMLLGMGFFLNLFVWSQDSSAAVPFTTMLALLALWTGVSLPLVYVGYFFGFRKQPYEHPVRTNQIPRAVPEQSWYSNVFVATCFSGILPFGAIFIELFFIFTAIWDKQFYYLFGFLFIVFVILIISVSQISVVMVYFQLCNEDYHWWWRSFIISGGSAVYVFVYAIFYYITKLEINTFIASLLYFGYSLLMAITFFILTGTIGFYAAYFFVRRIYGAIKID